MKSFSMKLVFPLLSILFFSLCSCSSTNEFNRKSNQKAKNLMSFHLKKLNLYRDILYSDNIDTTKSVTFSVDESANFYESISLVESYREYQKEMFITPLKYNISNWNEFYNLNKDNVYLDKNKVIKFKNAPIYLEKNPINYLNSIIDDIEKMVVDKNTLFPEIDYLLEIIEKVTKIEADNLDYNLPSLENIKQWRDWLTINSSKLYWNKGTQEVIVKY